ncbi:MAG: VTT domain-containing protein [bacterium]|nr:VTT domain-containing protein [bacterium]
MKYLEKIISFYSRQRFWILLVLSAVVLFLIFLPLVFFTPVAKIFTDPAGFKAVALSYGEWAMAVYVVLGIFAIMVPSLPNEIVSIAGGIIFGFWIAFLLGLLVRVIGSSINYWIGTRIRKGIYLKLVNEKEKEKLRIYTEKIGWQTAFIARFLPSADTDLIAFVAGMAKMNYWKFILASFLGMLAPLALAIYVGASLLKGKSLFIVLIIFYAVGMLLAPKIIKSFSKIKWRKLWIVRKLLKN